VSLLVLLPFLQKDFNISLLEIGFLSATLTGISILISFYAGHINDTVGNKNAIVISILAYLIAWFGLSVAHTSWFLYPIYALGGISSGLFDPISSAIVARQAEDTKRGEEIANFGSVGDVGRIALTSLTTFLVAIVTWRGASIIFTICGIIFFAIFVITQKGNNQVHTKDEDLTKVHPLHLLKSQAYFYALIAGTLDSFASSSLYIFLPFLLIPKGINIETTGFFTTLFFVGYFLGRRILGKYADSHGTARVLIIGEICMALLITSLIFINSYWLIIINLFLLGVFTRGTSPVIKTMLVEGLEKKDLERGYSLYSAANRTSNAISRPMFAFVGNYLGIASIFYLSGLVALLTIVPAIQFYKSKSK
jgi:MFS family permease